MTEENAIAPGEEKSKFVGGQEEGAAMLAAFQRALRAGKKKSAVPTVVKGSWEEDKHPRDHGKFAEKDGAEEEKPEWDGEIDAEEVDVDRGREYLRSWNFHDSDGDYKQDVRLAHGTYYPFPDDADSKAVDVWRWESCQDGDVIEQGEWTTDEDEARNQGESYAEENHQEPPDEDDEEEDEGKDEDGRGTPSKAGLTSDANTGQATTIPIASVTFPGGLLPDVTPLEDNRQRPIIVARHGRSYQIVDGVGRASGIKNAGKSYIHAIVVTQADLNQNSSSQGDDADWVASMHRKYAPNSLMAIEDAE